MLISVDGSKPAAIAVQSASSLMPLGLACAGRRHPTALAVHFPSLFRKAGEKLQWQ